MSRLYHTLLHAACGFARRIDAEKYVFDIGLVVLTSAELLYILVAVLFFKGITGIDAFGASYRARIWVIGLVVLGLNYLYFYPKRGNVSSFAPATSGQRWLVRAFFMAPAVLLVPAMMIGVGGLP